MRQQLSESGAAAEIALPVVTKWSSANRRAVGTFLRGRHG